MKAVFRKRVKYSGKYYAAGTAIEVSDQDAEALKAHGAELLGDDQGDQEDQDGDGDLLENASTEELKAYAAKHNIDLGRSTSRNGIIEKIKAATEK